MKPFYCNIVIRHEGKVGEMVFLDISETRIVVSQEKEGKQQSREIPLKDYAYVIIANVFNYLHSEFESVDQGYEKICKDIIMMACLTEVEKNPAKFASINLLWDIHFLNGDVFNFIRDKKSDDSFSFSSPEIFVEKDIMNLSTFCNVSEVVLAANGDTVGVLCGDENSVVH